MAFGNGSGSSSGDKDSSSMNEDRARTMYNRHSAYQTQLLEAFYRDNPQPTEEQRQQLSREIGLDVKQIKFWYQNKKALTKAQVDRADNNVLRAENERISYENEALREALNSMTILCSDCGGDQHERNSILKKLVTDNAKLKQQFGDLSKMMVKYTGKLPLIPVDPVRTPLSVMNNQQEAGGGSSSTIPPMMMMNNDALNQQQGFFQNPNNSSSTIPPPPAMMMMNNAGLNNYDSAANLNHQQGPAQDGLLMPDNNLLISSPNNHLEPVVMEETGDNNAAGVVEGPTTLEELMKLLA